MTDNELQAKSDNELTELAKSLQDKLTPGSTGFFPPVPHENAELLDRAMRELLRRGLTLPNR